MFISRPRDERVTAFTLWLFRRPFDRKLRSLSTSRTDDQYGARLQTVIALEPAHVFDQDVRFDFSGATAHDASAGLTKQHRFHSADLLMHII
jgi:hypothetical protein